MRVCIVGGGGGASNAVNVIHNLDGESQIDVFDKRGEIGYEPCEIPQVLNGFLPAWQDITVFRPKYYRDRNTTVHLNTEVTDIIPGEKCIVAGGQSYGYDKLILDLGSVSVIPPIPGLDGRNEFMLDTSLETARLFQEAVPNYSTAAIVGAGQIGVEAAAVLKSRGYKNIYMLARHGSTFRAQLDKEMSAVIERRIEGEGIELILSSDIQGISSRGDRKIVSLPGRELEVDLVFFATGAKPNVDLARRAGIRIGETGAIAVNTYLQTSEPDIYAIGDCMENWDRVTGTTRIYQTATSGATEGRIAANNLMLGDVLPHQGTVMTFITDVFGYEVGAVGFTETSAKNLGFDIVSHVMRTATRRRSYGGKRIHIKLVADHKTQTLMGAQIISPEMVAGKLDRLALAIAERVPIPELALIDTCYSPTVGSAYESTVMALDQLMAKLREK
ncbi:MAG: FAD-dependent oxidoreductase [Dehalococcoidia bacterium]|nr:FAD-dependent oxidoreductase [Dehalococcoidia bacterium]